MSNDSGHTFFSRSVMAGLFAGIIATLANLMFNVFFREYSGFPLNDIINVSSIIFATCLTLTVAGLLYYVLERYLKRGMWFYIMLIVVLTVLGIRLAFQVERSDNPVWNLDFSELFLGVIAISGACAAILVPLLVRRENGVI